MSIFPSCGFDVLLPSSGVPAGERLNGTVVLTAHQAIARAERLQVAFISKVWAGYGSGKHRSVRRATLFHAPLELGVSGELAAGRHAHPFALDLPPWLPPSYAGNDCGIENSMSVRLDVDWALDPKKTFLPPVVALRQHAVVAPAMIRSHPSFHDTVIVEVALKSSSVVQGGTIEGSVALRGGLTARFDALELALVGHATMSFARHDRRRGLAHKFRIEAERLRDGRNVPFVLPIDPSFPPTFRNGFIDHEVSLEVGLDIPWAVDPSFGVPLVLLPAGSMVSGEVAPIVVGSERVRLLARALAHGTGLTEGPHPVLVEGKLGCAAVRVVDNPRGSRLGVDVDFDFPSVDLGLELRPESLFDLGASPLLPPALAKRFALRRKPEPDTAPVPDAAIARFVELVTRAAEHADDVRFSDHHLGLSYVVHDDNQASFDALARVITQKAADIAQAISDPAYGLPFPSAIAAARHAWQAMAVAHGAVLVPNRPAIDGIVLSARMPGGDERLLRATLRAVWSAKGPSGIEWDVDLRAMPIPLKPTDAIQKHRSSEGSLPESLASLEKYFSSVELRGHDSVTLAASGWNEDPRAWLTGLEAFFAWVLEVRGERKADSPYR